MSVVVVVTAFPAPGQRAEVVAAFEAAITRVHGEPGQPCVMISGSASSCGDSTWMRWTSTPSISVVNICSAFSSASHARQS
jgi:hypothetical protein